MLDYHEVNEEKKKEITDYPPEKLSSAGISAVRWPGGW